MEVNKSQKLIADQINALVKDYSTNKFKKNKFIPYESEIPVSGKVIGSEEIINMVNASLDGWLTTGRFNEKFEKKLADFIGVEKLLTVNSGSSANLVAFSTLTSSKLGSKAIKKGDEIISVAAGFPTTVNPIIQFGATPVFVDVNLITHNIDAYKIEAAITKKTRAIMLAHTLGNPFNLEIICKICEKYDLWLIEDCCDSLGTTYKNKHVGTFGDIGTLSFYPAHHITMGEGGAVFSTNKELMTIAESFRDWGRDCYCKPGMDNTCGKRFCWKLGDLPEGYDHKYIYSHAGYNLKITDMQAACGLAQLDKVKHFIDTRRYNFNYLYEGLSSCKDYISFVSPEPYSNPSWFGFLITIKDKSVNREDLIQFLNEKKIGTRLLFAGDITKQPYMKNVNYKVSGDLNNTQIILKNSFWIGVYPGLSKDHLDFVINEFETYFGLNF